jgi:hypothetical protein
LRLKVSETRKRGLVKFQKGMIFGVVSRKHGVLEDGYIIHSTRIVEGFKRIQMNEGSMACCWDP